MSKKCKKKQTTKNLAAAERQTYVNKLRKLERQVKRFPNDHVAAHNLAVFKAEGVKAKGFGG